MARTAEDVGFDSLWFPDHLLFNRPTGTFGVLDCWTLLAAVAAVTRRIALGPFVSCMSFRNPPLLAKMADTVDEISGGRLILALGAGWHEREYRAFGFPFDHRASRFAEGIAIIHALLRTGAVDFAGHYFTAQECLLRLRGPPGNHIPIMIGTKGERVLRLAARYADSWNVDWVLPAQLPALQAPEDAACARERSRHLSIGENTRRSPMCALRTPGFVRAHPLVTLVGFAFLSLVLLAPSPAPVHAATASRTALEDGTAITVTGQHFALRTPVHLDFTSDDFSAVPMNHAAMGVTSDADGNFEVQVPWQMMPPFGCFRNEMVTITGSTADGAAAMTAVCQPPAIVAA